jgi:hypothetical protein
LNMNDEERKNISIIIKYKCILYTNNILYIIQINNNIRQ